MTIDVERIFKEAGAIREGHFLLTSGLHSPTYLEKAQVLQFPRYTEQLCHLIAERFRREAIQVVVGPTVGGVILSFEVARQLGVRSLFAEREGDKRVFRRGFCLGPGERVLVVDDILTTGGSVSEVVGEVRRLGAVVAGVAVLISRTREKVDFGAPFFSCHELYLPTYAPEQCPQCRAGIPLVKPGSSGPG